MLRGFLILVLAAMGLVLSGLPLNACGDRLLVLGRGVRFQIAEAEYPASILHFMNPARPESGLGDSKLKAILVQAGHRLHSVTSAQEFAEALRTSRFDLVLIDFADAPGLEELLPASASKPLVLPFLYTKEKTIISAAVKQYGLVLKAPGKVGYMLATLDRAMELKQKRSRQHKPLA